MTDAPPPPGPTGPSGGTIQRSTLTVRAYIEPADASIAATAGVSLAGLVVRLSRRPSTESPRTAVTNSGGVAQFEGLLQGYYEISVDRALAPSELAALPLEDRDASVFAGGQVLYVSPPAASAELGLVAARRGSLIISEMWWHKAFMPVASEFLEVYNNSDTTIYLDAMHVFHTRATMHTSFTGQPCATVRSEERLDPTGIWAYFVFRFPGTAGGRQLPITAGEARVIALDAVNFSTLSSALPDLSLASFEMIGDDSDPNNPFAEDLLYVTRRSTESHGVGLPTLGVVGLARPLAVDSTQLARRLIANVTATGEPWPAFKIPREAILDVVSITKTPELDALFRQTLPNVVDCDPFIAPVFDRSPAAMVDTRVPIAMSRKSLGRSASGVEILQRTRNSSRDFEYAQPLRRSLRRPQ
jgi:hypothetical protein